MEESIHTPRNSPVDWIHHESLNNSPIGTIEYTNDCEHKIDVNDDFRIEDHIIYNFFTPEKANTISKQSNQQRLQDLEYEKGFTQKIVKYIKTDNLNLNALCARITNSFLKLSSLNNGNLYNMFNCHLFDISMILIYLSNREEIGIVDTLVNLMYSKFIDESLFYLPQLCTLFAYKKYTQSLESYLLDRCINQMKFSLQVAWLIGSYSEDESNQKVAETYEDLLRKVEETIVNGRRSTTLSKYGGHKYSKINDNLRASFVFQTSCDKEHRLIYFDKCIDFYNLLKKMCEDLKEYPKEETLSCKKTRASALHEYLDTFNHELESLRKEIDTTEHYEQRTESNSIVLNLFKGYILPFDDSSSTKDCDNSLIVRFLPKYSFCFSTKARVPTKICVECVKAEECGKWDDLYIDPDEDEIISTYTTGKAKTYSNNNLILWKKSSKNLVKKSLTEFFAEVTENPVKVNAPQDSITSKNDFLEDAVIVNFTSDVINPFGKKWSVIASELKQSSPFRQFSTYSVKNFIAKANDDLRQELLAMQLIKKFNRIFTNADIKLNLHPYEILITSSSSGLIEFLPNTNSIDGIKRSLPSGWTLDTFFRKFFQERFDIAQKNFAESLAGYSLICYYLQIKDRHNGNILLDMNGNLIHIDFGFILGINPGNLNFESGPFKLTSEYVDILDGIDSQMFEYYKSLMIRGMIECKKHVGPLVNIVEIMSHSSKLPCFEGSVVGNVIEKFRERFNAKKCNEDFRAIVNDLITASYDNFWTNKYDYYQNLTNGIYY